MGKYSILLFIAPLCIATACRTPVQTAAVPSQPEQKTANRAAPAPATEVVTVILKAHYNTAGRVVFDIDKLIKKEGYFKNLPTRPPGDYFVASFTDKNGDVIEKCAFENPLNRHVEYGDDSGKLATAELKSNEGSTGVRVNYTPSITTLHIYDRDGHEVSNLPLEIK